MANSFQAALESAEKIGTKVAKFEGNNRQMGASFLEEGDVIRIPQNFEVFQNNDLSTDDRKVCFTVAEIFDNDGNVAGGKQVYPGAFNRTVYGWHKDEDGKLVNLHKTYMSSGDPVKDFISETETQKSMEKIAGKKIRVKAVDHIETRTFDKKDTTTTPVYTFEYVG